MLSRSNRQPVIDRHEGQDNEYFSLVRLNGFALFVRPDRLFPGRTRAITCSGTCSIKLGSHWTRVMATAATAFRMSPSRTRTGASCRDPVGPWRLEFCRSGRVHQTAVRMQYRVLGFLRVGGTIFRALGSGCRRCRCALPLRHGHPAIAQKCSHLSDET